jgi:hypothetical protein
LVLALLLCSRIVMKNLTLRVFSPCVVAVAMLAATPTLGRAADTEPAPDRIFGVLPNYTTIEAPRGSTEQVPALTTRESFRLASLGTFDPVVYPFVGLVTALGQTSDESTYSARFATAFADNAIGNFMTTAIVPSLTHQDSRYYRRGDGGVFSRLAYAASRSVVTRTRAGRATFNISEVAGTAASASLSNLYYAPEDRTVSGTMTRWGTQVTWDLVANELKEFWPDIRSKLRKH